MALGEASVKILIFFLVFSILFPVAGYTLTVISEAPSIEGIDPQRLVDAGILLTEAITHNVTRGADHVHFDIGTSEYRVTWSTTNFVWQRRNNFFGFDLAPFTMEPNPITETSIILGWNATYNWTQITVTDVGETEFECFFTPYPPFTSITTSLADGNVTITIGKAAYAAGTDMFSFAGWFLGMVTGQASYGMPEFFIWLIRIFTIIGVLAFVILAKEFVPTLP